VRCAGGVCIGVGFVGMQCLKNPLYIVRCAGGGCIGAAVVLKRAEG